MGNAEKEENRKNEIEREAGGSLGNDGMANQIYQTEQDSKEEQKETLDEEDQ